MMLPPVAPPRSLSTMDRPGDTFQTEPCPGCTTTPCAPIADPSLGASPPRSATLSARPSLQRDARARADRTVGRTASVLLDDPAGPTDDRRGQGDPDGSRGLEVDHQRPPRVLQRKIAGPGTVQDLLHVPRCLPEHIDDVRRECHQPAGLGDLQMAPDGG